MSRIYESDSRLPSDLVRQSLVKAICNDFSREPFENHNFARFCSKIHELELKHYPKFKKRRPSSVRSQFFLDETDKARKNFEFWTRGHCRYEHLFEHFGCSVNIMISENRIILITSEDTKHIYFGDL